MIYSNYTTKPSKTDIRTTTVASVGDPDAGDPVDGAQVDHPPRPLLLLGVSARAVRRHPGSVVSVDRQFRSAGLAVVHEEEERALVCGLQIREVLLQADCKFRQIFVCYEAFLFQFITHVHFY